MEALRLAGCIIVNPERRILLLHRNTTKRRQWEIPGGKLDPNENATKAAVREMREETGLEVEVTRELGTVPFDEDGQTLLYTWFLAEILDGHPEVQNPETHDKCTYFALDELTQIQSELSPNVRNFLDQVSSGNIFL
jgi:8-oxo-dGTP diphosphatase